MKKRVKDALKATPNCWWFMPPANGFGRSGVPDFVGHVNGRFFAVETKFGRGTTTANQEREIHAIGGANGQVWVVRDSDVDAWEMAFKGWAARCL
ncbi:MAG: VRR-NUC domain-containing protein [Schleiferiaceae bacterium]